VRIERLATGGDGVGKLEDGRTLFVPRTAVGDLVEVADLRLHKRFARGQVGRLVEEGPGRAAPRCRHYVKDRCGGCQLQHLDAARQVAAKRSFIGDSLRRLGKLDVADPEVVPSEAEFGYRTKVTLAKGKDGRLGLHREGEAGRVFALERCELIAPKLQELWERLRPLQSHLPRETERVVLRLDRDGQAHIIVETSGTQVWPAGPLGPLAVVWWRPAGGSPRVVAGGEGRTAYPATVFEQVNPEMGMKARAFAVEQAGEVRGRHCWDLYAGIGETTEMLLDRGATVESIEGDRRAVELAARRTLDARRTTHDVRQLAGKVEDALSQLRTPSVVITNPPRVGMEERAVVGIRAARPKRIVYVSCDPATLARDVARLGEGWRVASVRGFDLFPQTAHVETVLTLEGA